MRFEVQVLDVTRYGQGCGSGEREEGSKLSNCNFSFGQYDKEGHGHLEITRGNETCPKDAHDASRLNLSLVYEMCAKPEALDKHGHCAELGRPCGSAPYVGKCWECGRDMCKE